MFHHHNGHDLSQLDDALKTFHSKLSTFDTRLKEVLKDHEGLKESLITHKNEIEGLKAK